MIRQLTLFGGVGLTATLLHVAVALLAREGFQLPAQAANFLGFCAAVCLSYLGHAFVTFRATDNHKLQVPRFFIVALAGLATSSAITFVVYTRLQGSFTLAMGIVAVTVPPVTYLVSKYWVFDGRHRSYVGWQGLLAASGIAVAFLLVFWGHYINHDVAWYLVATRKWLHGGAQLYVDIYEINPPFNFYLTIPAILLADLLRISDTHAQYLFVAALLVVSLTWVWNLLAQDPRLSTLRRFLILTFTGLAIMLAASENIAQREHLMLLFILPYVFGYLILPAPDQGRGAVTRAGFAAIGLCIKPHFMLYPIALTLLMIWRRKSLWPILSPANLVILCAGAIYVVLVMLLHPEYLRDIAPLALKIYSAYGFGTEFIILMARPLAIILFILMSLLVLVKPEKIKGFGALFAVVAAALISYLFQWTGFSYQILPNQTFIVIACIWILAQPNAPKPLAICSWVTGAYLVYLQLSTGFYHNLHYGALSKAMGDQKTSYGLMVFSTGVGVGFPLALETQADWISRYPAMWLIPGAVNEIAKDNCSGDQSRCDELRAILSRTRTDIVSDFENGAPDVLVFALSSRYITDRNFSFHKFLSQDPRYTKLISEYEIKEQLRLFTIMTRKPRG